MARFGNLLKKRSLLKLGVIILLLGIIFIVACNWIIIIHSQKYLYDDLSELPERKTALVLGTSKNLASGQPNSYFHERIDAAARLYHAGKVEYLILSGDNKTRYYNEPVQMQREILKHGVPGERVYLDYAGFRTLDSMIRSKMVFGEDSIIVVSQKFHNQRAVFIAHANGNEAVGFNANNIAPGLKMYVREVFARVKVFIDLIFRIKPRHLGEKITLGRDIKNDIPGNK